MITTGKQGKMMREEDISNNHNHKNAFTSHFSPNFFVYLKKKHISPKKIDKEDVES